MPNSGEQWRLGHRTALDGVRGIACLLVLTAHLVISETGRFAGGGGAGVTMFFTLSGFLITALLLEERDRTGRTRLGAFYLRRARRLLPALTVYVLAMLALAPIIGPWFADLRGATWSLLYLSNWRMVDGETFGALSHTWSLAIEEQFYLLWPLALIVVLRRAPETILLGITAVGIAASIYQAVTLWDGPLTVNRIYFGSDTRANAILLGCAAAIIARKLGAGRGRPLLATALVLAVIPLGFVSGIQAIFVWMPIAVAALTATALIIGTRGTWTGPLAHPALGWIGQRSYGLYLWHYAAVTALPSFGLTWVQWAPLYVVLTLAATVLSWRYVEQPFLTKRTPADTPAASRHRAITEAPENAGR